MPSEVKSPSKLHNETLCSAVLKELNVTSRYPKVCEQVETLPLDRSKLFAFGYNPSIIEQGGKIWMAYRFHRKTSSTQLAIGEITDAGDVLTNRIQELPGKSLEDPKLFIHCGQLALSWVESKFPEELKSVVKWKMLPNGVTLQPEIGKNDWTATEKNWLFLEAEEDLWCIYNDVCRYSLIGKIFMTLAAPKWPYGEIRGGCIVPWDGKLLRFFHSPLDNEWTSRQFRRYFVGALLMEPQPPFKTIRVSKRPVLYGSEVCRLKVKDRPFHWKSNVVFPGGAIVRGDHIVLAVGTNDSCIELCKLTEKDLNL